MRRKGLERFDVASQEIQLMRCNMASCLDLCRASDPMWITSPRGSSVRSSSEPASLTAEAVISQQMFQEILRLIAELWQQPPLAPA
jgi:hypothetical protein